MDALICRRCHRPVVYGAAEYDLFEQMHYVCFHYAFEHELADPGLDPDLECRAGGCPSANTASLAPLIRYQGVDLAQAGNTVVPALLALEGLGCDVEYDGKWFTATVGGGRFTADDPVALLGLIKLADVRRPWRADDAEIDDTLARYGLR